ncbi:MAG: sugar ABC transporter permease [Treponema sp.]|jgi:raffinose/stachyose/melibiose transport system permease protein|nr:sugar ABC transporter permease [Treponema sp.]
MKRSWKDAKQTGFFLFSLPALLLFSLLYVYPMLGGLYYSLTDWNGLAKTFKITGIENYIQIFTNVRVRMSMLFTVKYTVLLVASVLVLATALALIVSYALHPRTRTFFRSMFFAPVVLSLITVGLIFNEIFYRIIPQLGRIAGSELLSKNILGNPKTVIFGILIVNIWQGVGIPFVMLLAGLQNIPTDLYEAATIDGANPVQAFRKITIPFLLPIFNVCFVLTFKNGLTVFEYIQAMTEGGPARSSEAVGFLIYKLAFWEYKMSYAMAISVLLLVVISLVSFAQIKISSRFEVGQL